MKIKQTEFRSQSSEQPFINGDAIFALATVPGKSAIAVFRCSGKAVWELFAGSFSRYSALERARSHSAVYGFLRWPQVGEPGRFSSSEILDEILLLKFCAPKSYTGEDALEIHCHGSLAVLDALRKLLFVLGLREAERGEFSYRSIRCGKRSLHQAEAIALLSESQTQNQRRSALAHWEQRESPLNRHLRKLRAELLQVLARTELQLDYDESELEFRYELPESLSVVKKTLQSVQDSLSAYELQKSCWNPCRVVLAGAANSGKSSLFNRLLSRERAIVSQQAGTTRDYLEAHLELEGQGIVLCDTAGLRFQSDDPIEGQGIERSRQLIEQADFLLLLTDIRTALADLAETSTLGVQLLAETSKSGPCEATGPEAIAQLRLQRATLYEKVCIEIWNKSDLLPSEQRSKIPLDDWKEQLRKQWQCDNGDVVLHFCSALSGEGLPQLLAELGRRLPAMSEATAETPLNERQAGLLQETAALLQEYCDGLHEEVQLFDLDWASELLRQICGRLGELTGEECNKEMLRDIFAQFCVGK